VKAIAYTNKGAELICNAGEESFVVATCQEARGMNAVEIAERLAQLLNFITSTKDRANKKDEAIEQRVVPYLLSVDSKDVPDWLRNDVLRAYEI
jgi:hypothetical protein